MTSYVRSLCRSCPWERAARLLVTLMIIGCAPDAAPPSGGEQPALRGEPLSVTLATVPAAETSGAFTAVGGAGRIELRGERNTGSCVGADEREVYRSVRQADSVVVWLHRETVRAGGDDCAGVGLRFRYRAVIGPVPQGSYQLTVIEQDDHDGPGRLMGRPDTVFRTRVIVGQAASQ